MKKLNFLALGLILSAGFSQAQTYQNNTATAAADAVQRLSICGYGVQPGVNMSTINIPITGNITDPSKITVNVSLDASWLGDVVLELLSPSGQAITLIRRIGAAVNSSCGDSSSFIPSNILSFNSSNTAFIDAAAVGFFVGIPAGNYQPTYGTASYPKHHPGSMNTFLQGTQLNGEWRLYIYDYGVTELSNINSWQIIVANGATLKSSETGTFGSEISIKQNPVDDYLMVDVTNDFKSLNLEIYDASGKRIKSENLFKNTKNLQLDVRNLSPGMYLLTPVKDGERKQAIKFIKK